MKSHMALRAGRFHQIGSTRDIEIYSGLGVETKGKNAAQEKVYCAATFRGRNI